jgi:hypothetical protein
VRSLARSRTDGSGITSLIAVHCAPEPQLARLGSQLFRAGVLTQRTQIGRQIVRRDQGVQMIVASTSVQVRAK